jgi:chemotaxis signal transduction protein
MTGLAVLTAGGERYAVDLAPMERVQPVGAVTPVPGLRRPWAGIVALRGEILPALDVPSYLGRPPGTAGRPGAGAAGAPTWCAVVTHSGLRVALLSEEPVRLVAGPGDEAVTILDVASILADPALVVDD